MEKELNRSEDAMYFGREVPSRSISSSTNQKNKSGNSDEQNSKLDRKLNVETNIVGNIDIRLCMKCGIDSESLKRGTLI